MTVYVGPTFSCTGTVADLTGLREGEKVAHLTADTQGQMWTTAADLGLPDAREMGRRSSTSFRYIVTDFERNQAIRRGAKPLTAAAMYTLQGSRTRSA